MNSDNNKMEESKYAAELDSNQLVESLQEDDKFLNDLISFVAKMHNETKLDSKSSTDLGQKVNPKLKRLLNKLNQARSLDSLRNVGKYLAQVRELKVQFTQLSMQFTNNDIMALHCLHAIKILEALILHVTTRKEDKMSTYKKAKCQSLYNFDHATVPSHLTDQFVCPMQFGANKSQVSGHGGQVCNHTLY